MLDEDTTSQPIKIIGVYSKKDELDEELKEFKKSANANSLFRQLEYALLTKQSIIDYIYRDYGSIWFPDYMRSTIFVVDKKKQVHNLEPTLSRDQLSDMIYMCLFRKMNTLFFLGRGKT